MEPEQQTLWDKLKTAQRSGQDCALAYLKSCRKMLGLSQRDLQNSIGGNIRGYERRKYPIPDTVAEKLIELCNKSLDAKVNPLFDEADAALFKKAVQLSRIPKEIEDIDADKLPTNKRFGLLLKTYRKMAGISTNEVAKLIGLTSLQSVNYWETGSQPMNKKYLEPIIEISEEKLKENKLFNADFFRETYREDLLTRKRSAFDWGKFDAFTTNKDKAGFLIYHYIKWTSSTQIQCSQEIGYKDSVSLSSVIKGQTCMPPNKVEALIRFFDEKIPEDMRKDYYPALLRQCLELSHFEKGGKFNKGKAPVPSPSVDIGTGEVISAVQQMGKASLIQ